MKLVVLYTLKNLTSVSYIRPPNKELLFRVFQANKYIYKKILLTFYIESNM